MRSAHRAGRLGQEGRALAEERRRLRGKPRGRWQRRLKRIQRGGTRAPHQRLHRVDHSVRLVLAAPRPLRKAKGLHHFNPLLTHQSQEGLHLHGPIAVPHRQQNGRARHPAAAAAQVHVQVLLDHDPQLRGCTLQRPNQNHDQCLHRVEEVARETQPRFRHPP